MRSFLALEIPENIKEYSSKLLNIREETAKLSFVSKNKMHITLIFFADLKEEDISKIKDVLENINIKHFNINFEGISVFKNRNIINVIFIKSISKELKEYVKNIREYLDLLDISYDKKEFNSHITLARVKNIYEENSFNKSLEKLQNDFKPFSFQVNLVTLFSSDFINYKEIFKINF